MMPEIESCFVLLQLAGHNVKCRHPFYSRAVYAISENILHFWPNFYFVRFEIRFQLPNLFYGRQTVIGYSWSAFVLQDSIFLLLILREIAYGSKTENCLLQVLSIPHL